MAVNKTEICGTIAYLFVSQSDDEPSIVEVIIHSTKAVEGHPMTYVGQPGFRARIHIDRELIRSAKTTQNICCRVTITDDGKLVADNDPNPNAFMLEPMYENE